MKLAFLTISLLLVAQGAMAQTAPLKVQASLSNFKDSMIVVTRQGNGEKKDTVVARNGMFTFNLPLTQVQDVLLATPATLRMQERNYLSFLGVPGEEAHITGNERAYTITGSKYYREFHEADSVMDAARKPMMDFSERLSDRLKADSTARDAVLKMYQDSMPALEKQYTDKLVEFVKQHPDYECSAEVVRYLQGDLDTMEKAAALLSDRVKNGRMKQVFEEPIAQAKAKKEADEKAEKLQAKGVTAPAFTLNDINGKPLSLASFRGKYVLLDFWGSWCIWCIKGFPQMKEYYNKYKGKFEILGIDCSDTQAKWKEAVKKYQLPWKHVFCPRESNLLSQYGIQGFPTKILVGPDGKIVKTIVGEDPAFYTLLDETFGKKK